MLFNATAAGRSERGTMSPTDACQEGLFSAVPQPMRNVNIKQQPRRQQSEIGAHGEHRGNQDHGSCAISMT